MAELSPRWLSANRPPQGECTLICVPYAGGAATVFDSWQPRTTVLDIVAVQLPGRANRIAETPLTDLFDVVDQLERELSTLRQEYALFGHSMGGLVVFELARRIRDRGLRPPREIFVSGYPAPDGPMLSPVYDLPRAELVRWMVDSGGLDASLAGDDELLDLVLPMLRADLGLVDTYRYRPAPPLPWPITVLVAADDPFCPPADVTGWHAHTTAGCQVTVLPGNHFFLHDQADRMVQLIEHRLGAAEGARA